MCSQEVQLTANSTTKPATGEGNCRVISNFSLQHLIAATLFTKNCDKIERDNQGKPFGAFFEDIRSYASGAIMSSVAGLEAYINESYIAHESPLRQALPNFEKEFYKKKGGIEWKPILCKYQYALKLLGKHNLNEECTDFKNAKNLIALRNTLVHFKPFWDESYQKANLQKELKGKFETSPFCKDISDSVSNSEFASTSCMTYSCGKWAVETSYNLINNFSSSANLENRLTLHRDKLAI